MADDSFAPGSITADQFVRFAHAKKLKLECPVCASGALTVHVPGDGRRGLALIDLDLDTPNVGDMNVSFQLALQCKNCGFNRLFQRSVVNDWLEGHRE